MTKSLEGKHSEYYEAILQLRHVSQGVIDFTEEEIQRRGLSVVKVIELKTGLDYYLSDNNLTKTLGRRLQDKFGGEFLVTAKLHTKKKDKNLYRLTVLFRQTPFQKGDLVARGGEEYRVVTLGKEIILQHEKTGKKIHLKYAEMKKIKKIE
ncbi:hypothetical protein HY495_03125 [Candidatus Woesearchaeota archaeon]|nr:hypothetical protein [Candidatus Woesearchaeota archaeon]